MMSVLNTKLATGNASDVIIHNIGGATLPSEKLAVLDGDWAEHISEQSKPMTVNEDTFCGLLWVGRMENIRNQAMEIVNADLIFA